MVPGRLGESGLSPGLDQGAAKPVQFADTNQSLHHGLGGHVNHDYAMRRTRSRNPQASTTRSMEGTQPGPSPQHRVPFTPFGGSGGLRPPAAGGIFCLSLLSYPFNFAAMSAATFSPDSSMPPKIGPMR